MNETQTDLDALIADLRTDPRALGLMLQDTMMEAAAALASERERADALALIIEQVRLLDRNELRQGDGHLRFVDAYLLDAVLNQAPVDALAAHDADVKAQALESASVDWNKPHDSRTWAASDFMVARANENRKQAK